VGGGEGGGGGGGGGGVGGARGTLAVCQLRTNCVFNPERALKLGSRKLGLHGKVCELRLLASASGPVTNFC